MVPRQVLLTSHHVVQADSGSNEPPYGIISSDRNNEHGTFTWKFEIPANTAANVYVLLFIENQKAEIKGGITVKPAVTTYKDHPNYQLIGSLGSRTCTIIVKHECTIF